MNNPDNVRGVRLYKGKPKPARLRTVQGVTGYIIMKTILLLLVVVAFVAAAEAIKCYDCAPWVKGCYDFDAKATGVTEQKCDSHDHACVKGTATLTNGSTLAVRGCSSKNMAQLLFQLNPKNITDYGSWFCDSDLCNGVSTTGAGLVTLMALSVPLIFTIWQ